MSMVKCVKDKHEWFVEGNQYEIIGGNGFYYITDNDGYNWAESCDSEEDFVTYLNEKDMGTFELVPNTKHKDGLYICMKSNLHDFTPGRVYEIKNHTIEDDTGFSYGQFRETVDNLLDFLSGEVTFKEKPKTNTMMVVYVQFNEDGKPYLYRVPKNVYVSAGDTLIVDVGGHNKHVVALTNSQEISYDFCACIMEEATPDLKFIKGKSETVVNDTFFETEE